MANPVKCKICDAQLSGNEKKCPSCGTKVKKPIFKKWWFWTIIIIVLIGIIGGSSGGSSDPHKVGDMETQEPGVNSPSVQTEFGVGEIVELQNVRATMTKVYESSGAQFMAPSDGNTFVICEFEIENNSDKDIAVSSLMSFTAYFDDYSTTLSITALASANDSQLDGTVAAGKKIRGVVGYEVPSDWSNMEIRFTPDFWSGKDIIFVYGK